MGDVIMYFEEKMIDEVICFRTTPNGEWRPFDIKELSRRYAEAKAAALNDNSWTYCDDRLPEEQGWYLVSLVNGSGQGAVTRDYFYKAFYMPEVYAWRPLPEPAKGRDV